MRSRRQGNFASYNAAHTREFWRRLGRDIISMLWLNVYNEHSRPLKICGLFSKNPIFFANILAHHAQPKDLWHCWFERREERSLQRWHVAVQPGTQDSYWTVLRWPFILMMWMIYFFLSYLYYTICVFPFSLCQQPGNATCLLFFKERILATPWYQAVASNKVIEVLISVVMLITSNIRLYRIHIHRRLEGLTWTVATKTLLFAAQWCNAQL